MAQSDRIGKLEAEVRKWERIFDSLPDLIAIIDPQHQILRANRAMAHRLGLSVEQCVGQCCYRCVHDLDVLPDFCPHSQTIADGREHIAEVHENRLGGDFLVTCTPLLDEQGRFIASVHVARDITDRKRCEAEIRSVASFPEENPAPVLRATGNGDVLYANQPARRLLAEMGWHPEAPLPPVLLQAVRTAISTDAKQEIEIACAGDLVFVFTLVPCDAGYVNLYGRDITARKRAEDALRKREADLNHAQAVAHTGSWRLDYRSGELFWSDESYRIFGISPGVPLTYQTFLAAVHPADRQHVQHAWTVTLHGEPYDIEHRILVGDETKWVRERAELEFDEAGVLRGGFGTVQDITERKRAEENLKALNETLEQRVLERTAVAEWRTAQLRVLASELTQAEEQERRRIAQILHDQLQQILVAARIKVSVLRRQVADDKLVDALGQIDQLINQSIEESRTLTKQLSPPVLYDAGLIAGLGWLARQMGEKHGLPVDLCASPGTEPGDESIRILVFQAVRELLLNVVKHARADSARVELTATNDQRLRVIVSDTGIGFDSSVLDAHSDATGFGLFSLRERLGLIDGRLEVHSASGRGTQIVIDVPTAMSSATAYACTMPGNGTAAGSTGRTVEIVRGPLPRGKIRVLLADDHAVVRQGLAGLLREHQEIEVVGEAADGWQALELALQIRPDVVLMDITMPAMDGLQATRRIREVLPDVRIIGLSMHSEADMAAAMYKAGAVAYLPKDAPTEDLIAAILTPTTVSKPESWCETPILEAGPGTGDPPRN